MVVQLPTVQHLPPAWLEATCSASITKSHSLAPPLYLGKWTGILQADSGTPRH